MEGGIVTGEQDAMEIKEHICAGLLAHVDAGKTTSILGANKY